MNAPQPKSSTHRKERPAAESGLLLYPQNRVLCRLGDSEFDDGLGWNLDLLLRLGIEACTCLPLLLHQLAKTGQDEFAVLLDLFVKIVITSRNHASHSCPPKSDTAVLCPHAKLKSHNSMLLSSGYAAVPLSSG